MADQADTTTRLREAKKRLERAREVQDQAFQLWVAAEEIFKIVGHAYYRKKDAMLRALEKFDKAEAALHDAEAAARERGEG